MISSLCLSMIFSENRFPLFRIMLRRRRSRTPKLHSQRRAPPSLCTAFGRVRIALRARGWEGPGMEEFDTATLVRPQSPAATARPRVIPSQWILRPAHVGFRCIIRQAGAAR